MSVNINEVIEQALLLNPSDLHISVGVRPIIRVNGSLVQMKDFAKILQQDTVDFLKSILTENQFLSLEERGEIDVALSAPINFDVRMRLNAYRQRGTYSMAFRILNQNIPSFEFLGLNPLVMEKLCSLKHGLVIVTGPTGTGKTTTITAMIDWINKNRSTHIITIEDPIEYYHKHDKSIIHQRERGTDTADYNSALRAALRQDPDVIFIGEMRDLESISTAITAAETGHLVFSTLHTLSAAKTIDRIIDIFPSGQQQQIRTQLSMVLQGIISQQLLPSKDGSSRVLASEVLIMTPATANLIRENKISQIQNNITTGANLGMRTMDASLICLANEGKIDVKDAVGFASYPDYVKQNINVKKGARGGI